MSAIYGMLLTEVGRQHAARYDTDGAAVLHPAVMLQNGNQLSPFAVAAPELMQPPCLCVTSPTKKWCATAASKRASKAREVHAALSKDSAVHH